MKTFTVLTETHACQLAWLLNTTEDACGWSYQLRRVSDTCWYLAVYDDDVHVGNL